MTIKIRPDLQLLICFILVFSFDGFAQEEDYGCDKCTMLKEEYELAISPEKEKIYEFFKSECLETETLYFSDTGKLSDSVAAEKIRITSTGKCIDFNEVSEVVRKTGVKTMSFKVVNKDTVYTIGTKSPAFQGGDEALVRYLMKNVRLLENAQISGAPVTVYIQFIVMKTGALSEFKILRSPDEKLSQEAKRVVKSMPKWIPGEYKSKPVNMYFILPVRMKLQ